MIDRWAPKKVIEKTFGVRPFIFGTCFFAFLLVFELLFVRDDFGFTALSHHIASGDYPRFVVVLLLSTVSLALTWIFFLFAFASTKLTRVLYFLLFALSTFIEYAHFRAMGTFTDLVTTEIALFAVTPHYITDSAKLYFNVFSLIPIVVLGVLLFGTREGKRAVSSFLLVIAMFVTWSFGTAYFTGNQFYTTALNASFRSAVGFGVVWYVGSSVRPPRRTTSYTKRDELEYKSDASPKNNIIFIVDESVRGDYLKINGYPAGVTSVVDSFNEGGMVRNWGITASGATCSIQSNLLLLTGLNHLPDPDSKVYSLPTLFQFAKAMNYKTWYFDGQVSFVWNAKPSDAAYIDEGIRENRLRSKVADEFDIDAEIGRQVKEIVDGSTGNFIWINKRGIHHPYDDDFPNGADPAIASSFKAQYGAAVTYNSKAFFDALFGADAPRPGDYYIFTSDHGQTLDETRATHCIPFRGVANVPLFLIADPASLPAIDTSFKASHANIFATILDLMHFPTGERPFPYSISLFRATGPDSRPRSYYSGDVQGRSNGQLYAFEEDAGVQQETK